MRSISSEVGGNRKNDSRRITNGVRSSHCAYSLRSYHMTADWTACHRQSQRPFLHILTFHIFIPHSPYPQFSTEYMYSVSDNRLPVRHGCHHFYHIPVSIRNESPPSVPGLLLPLLCLSPPPRSRSVLLFLSTRFLMYALERIITGMAEPLFGLCYNALYDR